MPLLNCNIESSFLFFRKDDKRRRKQGEWWFLWITINKNAKEIGSFLENVILDKNTRRCNILSHLTKGYYEKKSTFSCSSVYEIIPVWKFSYSPSRFHHWFLLGQDQKSKKYLCLREPTSSILLREIIQLKKSRSLLNSEFVCPVFGFCFRGWLGDDESQSQGIVYCRTG